MQGGDIGTFYGRRIVVMMEPLVFSPPKERAVVSSARRLFRGRDNEAAQWTMNDSILTWITWHGKQFSIPTEIWSFLPEELFDRFSKRIGDVCGDYVVEYSRFENVHDAYLRLRSSSDILTVYDSDRERIEMLWHVRGYYVEENTTP